MRIVATSIKLTIALSTTLLSYCGSFLLGYHVDNPRIGRPFDAVVAKRKRATTYAILPSSILSMIVGNSNEMVHVNLKLSSPCHLSSKNSLKNMLDATNISALLMASIIIFTPWELNLDIGFGRWHQMQQQQTSQQPQHYNHLLHINMVQSRAYALSEDQLLVDAVWKEVSQQFVDKTYNGLGEEGWRQKRLDAIKSVSNIAAGPEDDDKEKVFETIRSMLKTLNDPYTRFLTPNQYESLTSYAKGGSTAGIGVQLLLEPRSQDVIVMNVAKNGPAQNAGILPGDVVEEIDGEEISGFTAEGVAAKCRGEVGTNIQMIVRHNNGEDDGSVSKIKTRLSFTRAKIEVNPVQVSTFSTDDGKQIGLLKIVSFNKETTSQVMEGMKQIRGTSAVVFDLRGNAGGYMPAGVEVAKLFLPPQTRVISEMGKSGKATVYISDGIGSDTKSPLYILVNRRTASASEILTAALQDNHRAIVVGTRTFGKGRIQNVQALEDGSGLAVTRAKYITPNGRDIHGIGITPDKEVDSCGADVSAASCLTGLI